MTIDNIIMGMRGISQPPCLNAKLVTQYFRQVEMYYNGLERPFRKLCLELHEFYLAPINRFLQLVAPMEDALKRKEEISQEIDKQIAQN